MFYKHLYVIFYDFWDKLINLEPSASLCFLLVLVFYRKGIPNGVQLTCQFLRIFSGPKEDHGTSELGQGSPGIPMRVGGAPPSRGCAPLSRGQLGGPLDVKPMPKIPINTQTFGN